MEEVRYTEWSLRLNQRAETQRTPLHGMIEVTHRCPLKCAHCYNNLPIGDREAQHNELTYEEHCRILDEITEAGCLWLLYTGGEIFVRRDFLDIYTYAKKQGLLITINKHEIWDMKRFVEEELGLEFRFDGMINPCIDCSQDPLAVRLSPQEVVELDLLDPKRMPEWKKFCERFNGPVHNPEQKDELYHCGGGVNSFVIDPYGMLGICLFSRGDAYDLRKGNFQEGWENFIFDLRREKITKQTKCVECEIKAMCGMCPANGELENRDAEEPVDFLCQVAHLRAKALGIQVKPHGECEYCKD